MNKNITLYAVLFAVALGSLSLGAPANVTLGGPQVELPEDISKEMRGIIEAIGIYDDPELATYINRIGQKLVANSSMPDADFTFTVLDSPDLNAFALKGGHIFINRGLLAVLDSEAELAGIIGHEIGHITERHHSRGKFQSVVSSITAKTLGYLTRSSDVYDAIRMYGA